jgi:hypothetical protein
MNKYGNLKELEMEMRHKNPRKKCVEVKPIRIDDKVMITNGSYRSKLGVVCSTGHGFYGIKIKRGIVKVRANQLLVISTGIIELLLQLRHDHSDKNWISADHYDMEVSKT